ncbi:GNAT family N-acetyltransferase [Psychrobacillus psychrotolerans]|uniref:hypothetical protein n=1 Tax=Psychrobacillus psychrotolerans TaxID=126156 RepID=UPI0015870C3B|nr:hypothetical protein [Psychrobacillus psychrotolerans]
MSLYEKDWLSILEANENRNPYLEYEFLYKLWLNLGQKEGIEIYAVKEHNRIIAFFPFHSKETWFGYILCFVAQNEFNTMDIIAKERDRDRVIMFVFDELINMKKSVVFSLNGLFQNGNTLRNLSKYLQARSMKEYLFVDNNIQLKSKSISRDFSPYTTKTIFSTNTFRAKSYRNFLWTKEMIISKVKRNST